ncbi:MAG: hypothetical protein KC583_15055, partial [Myxococcales bacterium]|nr:hypothetical protein [Myxococcales bacterium]
ISACGADGHDVIDLSATRVYEGTTRGNPAVYEACRNNMAPEAVFRVTLRTPVERLVASTAGSTFDTLVSIRRDCADEASEVACNDDVAAGDRTSRAVVERPELGDYFILVDGFLEEQGPFRLEVRAELADGTRCDAEAAGPVTCGVGRVCAEGFCTRSLCANTIDDDGDGRFDYPDDPGCTSVDDDDETNPDPLPQCANGQDDDFDGLIDYPNDPHCRDAADDEEALPPQCRDGRDNDGDGLVDLDDPGCSGPDDGSEFNLEACRDGADNDGDGLTDFPNDPGCADRVDPDEADPDPLPQCANGEDDDEDGNIDYPLDADSCFFAADDTEDDPCSRREAVEITGLRDVRGNTNEESDDFRASCSPFGDRESLLLWRVAEDRPLAGITFSTRGTNFDTVVYVRDACGGEELGCDDDSGPDFGTSFLTLGAQAPGTELFIFVDAGFTGSGGIWRLRVIPQLAEGANCAAPGTWTCAEGLECRDGAGGATCQRTICANGVDDDEDGLVDWPLDPGCVTPSDSDEADPELVPQCFNGVDDDEDGLIDFDAAGGGDPGCSATADDFEGPDCADGIDNNGNGAADYDRDGDGVRDPASDRGCACAADPSEDIQPQCNDGCDNDRDGVIDLEDPGCDDAEDDNEFHFPECIDRIDNDGDGLVDYPNDPGCTNEDDPVERNPDVLPACADGVDNDEDGRIDFAVDGTGDDGCLAAADDDENGPCDGELPALPPDGSARGTTTGRLNEHRGSCTVGDAP